MLKQAQQVVMNEWKKVLQEEWFMLKMAEREVNSNEKSISDRRKDLSEANRRG